MAQSPTKGHTNILIASGRESRDVRWVLSILAVVLVLAVGTAPGHLVVGWGVHLDASLDGEYSPGERLRLSVELSNPTDSTYRYQWRDGCYLDFSIVAEGRTYYDTRFPEHPCTLAVVRFEVPTWTSFTLFRGEIDSALWDGFEGCVTIEIFLAGTVLDAAAETCPSAGTLRPVPLLTLGVGLPGLVRSGETFPVVATVRSTGGSPADGAEVLWASPGLGSGQTLAGADGVARFIVTGPIVTEPTLLSLQLEAIKEGWMPTQTSRHLSVFPAESPALSLRVRLVSGDLVEVGRSAVIEVSVEDDRGVSVDSAEIAFETSGPLTVAGRTPISPSSEIVNLTGGPVNGSATLRIVANAAGFGGTETTIDFLVISQREQGRDPPPPIAQGADRWLVAVALALPAVLLLALILRRARKKVSGGED